MTVGGGPNPTKPFIGGMATSLFSRPSLSPLQQKGADAAAQYQARQAALQQNMIQDLAAAQTPQNTAGQLSQIFSMGAPRGAPSFQPMSMPTSAPSAPMPSAAMPQNTVMPPVFFPGEGGSQ
jgi:hypothetical protein